MKNSKRFLSLVLTLLMLFTLSSTAFAGFDDISKGIWDTAWEKSTESIEAAVTMFPGSDETERTIAWYSEAEEGYVELKSLKRTEKITASVKKTPEGDNRLWATVTDLEPGVYTYKCVSGDFTSKTYTFNVESADKSTVLYVSDIHITDDNEDNENELRDTSYLWDTTIESAVLQAASEGNTIDLIVSGGDQASEGLRNEYEGLSSSNLVKSIPFSISVGNHDRKSVGYKYYTANPNEADQTFKSYIGTDYWFRQGNALFLILDSCNVSMREHYEFMEQATEANTDATWIIAVMHHDMFGGREPWLDTENTMLRLLWTPFFDEFGVDMCLYGHSHYYSVSNVIYGRKTVEKTGHNAEVTDPAGTIYMASGSISRHAPLLDDEGNTPPVGENAGYTWLEDETVYSLMEFTDDTLTFKSYTVESGEEFNRLTITKTSKAGGHTYKNSAWYLKPVAFFVGRIVNIINNIDMYNRYKDQGFDVSLKEGLIGS
ncbi:MAG: metallophosphoesterase family protein [Clostridia bacterium]|nr:metallophosphoesterase family protein [Clostridia bacterium]